MKILVLLAFTIISLMITSTPAFAGSEIPEFFKENVIDSFILQAPFKEISLAQKSATNFLDLKKLKFDGTISYNDQGGPKLLHVKISIKGFSTSMACAFPKLELKFLNSDNSIFVGIKKIDLNTHCDDSTAADANNYFIKGMKNNHREVVAYRILNALNLETLATRPAKVSYIDSKTNSHPDSAPKEEYPAFFIQDKSDYIARNNLTEIKGPNDPFKTLDVQQGKSIPEQYSFLSVKENEDKIDKVQIAKIEIFQALIMNNDWFVKLEKTDSRSNSARDDLWNMKLFENSQTQTWSFLAQDFNLCGLTLIDVMPDAIAYLVFQPKFLNLLTNDEKTKLINEFEQSREQIILQTNIVKDDPSYSRIKEYLQKRFDYILGELKKQTL